jgi:uncharacterized protein YlxP (DUF503 family)
VKQNPVMHITACILDLGIPGCRSLKEKRGRILPLLAQLKNRFGLAVAEVAAQDSRDSAAIACVAVSTDPAHNERVLQSALRWIEKYRRDLEIRNADMERR